jgi:hypothetical protein
MVVVVGQVQKFVRGGVTCAALAIPSRLQSRFATRYRSGTWLHSGRCSLVQTSSCRSCPWEVYACSTMCRAIWRKMELSPSRRSLGRRWRNWSYAGRLRSGRCAGGQPQNRAAAESAGARASPQGEEYFGNRPGARRGRRAVYRQLRGFYRSFPNRIASLARASDG